MLIGGGGKRTPVQTDSLSEKSSLYEENGDEYVSPAKDYSEMEWAEINGETFNGTEEYVESVFDMDEIQNESKDNSASEKESVVASLIWDLKMEF